MGTVRVPAVSSHVTYMTDKHVNQWSEYGILGENICKLFGFENTFSLVIRIKIEVQKYREIQQSLNNMVPLLVQKEIQQPTGGKKKKPFMQYKRPECKLHNSAGWGQASRYFYWLWNGVGERCSLLSVSRGYLLPHQRKAAQRSFRSISKKGCSGKRANVQH